VNAAVPTICENAAPMVEPFISEIPDAAPPERPKVVYVMGSGHSGSTILGVTLGNCANVFYAGELDNWLIRSGAPVLGGSERVRFWNAVRAGVAGAEDLFGDAAKRYLERSLSLFRIHQRPVRRRLRPRYRRVAEDLYHAIARTADVTHIVDSSHFPLRARELRSLDGIDLYLIFLIRDPQSVVESFNLHVNRHDRRARILRILNTNIDLWMTHLLSVFVFLRHPRNRRMLLRHEDFLADPSGVLRHILDRVDCAAELPDLTSLRTGFPLFGNRLIKSEVVALKRRISPPRRGSRMTTLLQLPWAAVFSRLRPVAAAQDRPSVGHEQAAAAR
jgi:Sulfotransferase family